MRTFKLVCVRGSFGLNTQTMQPLSKESYYLVDTETGWQAHVGHEDSAVRHIAKLFDGLGSTWAQKVVESLKSGIEFVTVEAALKTDPIFNPPQCDRSFFKHFNVFNSSMFNEEILPSLDTQSREEMKAHVMIHGPDSHAYISENHGPYGLEDFSVTFTDKPDIVLSVFATEEDAKDFCLQLGLKVA